MNKQHDRNYVAKHMNTYNRASVVPDKRSKHLDDAYEQDLVYEIDDGPLTDEQIDVVRSYTNSDFNVLGFTRKVK